MVLSEAIKEVEEALEGRIDPNIHGNPVEVCSGGLRSEPRDPYPALYSTPERAVRAWLAQMMVFIERNPIIWVKWMKKPELIGYQMTSMDKRDSSHRVTNDRWVVCSTFATKAKEPCTNVDD